MAQCSTGAAQPPGVDPHLVALSNAWVRWAVARWRQGSSGSGAPLAQSQGGPLAQVAPLGVVPRGPLAQVLRWRGAGGSLADIGGARGRSGSGWSSGSTLHSYRSGLSSWGRAWAAEQQFASGVVSSMEQRGVTKACHATSHYTGDPTPPSAVAERLPLKPTAQTLSLSVS